MIASRLGNTLATLLPHNMIALSRWIISEREPLQTGHSSRLAILVNRKSGPARSTVSNCPRIAVGNARSLFVASDAARVPISPTIVAVTPAVSQDSTDSDSAYGIMHSRHGVSGGLNREI